MTSWLRRIAVTGIGAVALSSNACSPKDLEDVGRCAGDPAERFEQDPPRDGGSEERIAVAATEVAWERYAYGIQGSGRDYVGSVDITWGRGSIDLGCRKVPLVVTTVWPIPDGHAVQALAVDGRDWYPILFLCSSAGNLDWIEYASTNGVETTYESGHGRCQFDASRSKEVSVSLPATDMVFPRLLGGYEITGPEILIFPGAPGVISADGFDWPLLPFAASGKSPEHWIHAMILHAVGASYALLHLDEEESELTVYDSQSLPGLEDGVGHGLDFAVTRATTP